MQADMSDFYTSPKQLFICFFDENKRFLERTIVEKMYDFIDNRCMKKGFDHRVGHFWALSMTSASSNASCLWC